jgi:hypothetical protein
MTSFWIVTPNWEDTFSEDDLPATFSDLIAAGHPYTIEAIPPDDDEADFDDDDYYGHPSLTAAERNPSLCR